MTLEEVKRFLSKIKYKPNWSFDAKLEHYNPEYCTVRARMSVNDAYGVQQEEIDIVSHFLFPLDRANPHALQAIL